MPKKLNNFSKYILIFVFFLTINTVVNAQYNSFYEQLENYKSVLNQVEQSDYYTTDELLILSQKIQLREKFIKTLKSDIQTFNSKISKIEKTIEKLNSDLEIAKKQYATLLRFAYLHKTESSFFTFILSARSISQAYLRYKYIKIITSYTKRQAQAILFYKKQLEYQKEILSNEKNIRELFNKSYSNQRSLLTNDLDKQLKYIANLKQKADTLRTSLEQYHQWQNELNQSITAEISEKKGDDIGKITKKFEMNKGLMPMPLSNAIVISAYGEHPHPTLKNIKVKNDGIDITSNTDNQAKAVFEGVVSSIVLIPGHNSAVLIKHGDYYTVYTNLVELKVKLNKKIKQGDVIGKVAISEDRNLPILNFQVWHLTMKKDPIVWVKR